MFMNSTSLSSSLRVCQSSCRLCSSCSRPWTQQSPGIQQKRWITRGHIRRLKEAEAEWKARYMKIEEGGKQSMLSLLEERGYVNQIVGNRKHLNDLLNRRRCGIYAGVDPTGPSLHIGHVVPFMALGWLYIHGYSTHFLLGGGTAKFGDPSLRSTPREKQERKYRKANMASIHMQLKKLSASIETYAGKKGYKREWAWRREIINNGIWLGKTTISEVLNTMGRGLRIGPLLGRDTVKHRLDSKEGLSFTEFAYPVLQAWDWWNLYQRGCQIQIGGADQFGNILTGVEAIKAARKFQSVDFDGVPQPKKTSGSESESESESKSESSGLEHGKRPDADPLDDPVGFTVPLLTTASGEKFGKSEGNAIWLDQQFTSSFDLYQFFLRSSDEDVERYLKLFTFLPTDSIRQVMIKHSQDKSKRVAQHLLASEFVELIHGRAEAARTKEQHEKSFGKEVSIDSLREDADAAAASTTQTNDTNKTDSETTVPGDWNNSLNKYARPTHRENAPSLHLMLPRSVMMGRSFPSILHSAGMVSSRSEGHRLIQNQGCHIGGRAGEKKRASPMGDSLSFKPIQQGEALNEHDHIVDGELIILRVGKWKMKIIKIVSDEEYAQSGQTCPGLHDDDSAESFEEMLKSEQEERERVKIFRTAKGKLRNAARIRKMVEEEARRDYRLE